MKKQFRDSVLLCLVLSLGILGCSGKESGNNSSSGSSSSARSSQSGGNQPAFIEATDNDFEVLLASDNTAIITKYIGSGGNVSIPAKIQGIQVTEIGIQAFSRSSLTSVRLPEGLKTIGTGAFSSTSVTTVIIPNTVTTIEQGAFGACKELKSLTIPDSVVNFGTGIFIASGIENFTFPAGLIASKEIPDAMFGQCVFERMVIPEGITTLGNEVFARSKLTSITLPSTLRKIGGAVFDQCRELTEVIIPESVTSVEWDDVWVPQFRECSKLNLASQARLIQLGYTKGFGAW